MENLAVSASLSLLLITDVVAYSFAAPPCDELVECLICYKGLICGGYLTSVSPKYSFQYNFIVTIMLWMADISFFVV